MSRWRKHGRVSVYVKKVGAVRWCAKLIDPEAGSGFSSVSIWRDDTLVNVGSGHTRRMALALMERGIKEHGDAP